MKRKTVGFVIWALSSVLPAAWLVEAHTVGRGPLDAPGRLVLRRTAAVVVDRS